MYRYYFVNTYYFVSFDNGFLEFAQVCSITCNSVSDALRRLHDTTNDPQTWVNVSKEEYLQLRNE